MKSHSALITDEENSMDSEINKLKQCVPSDNNGIRVEDIKTCDNEIANEAIGLQAKTLKRRSRCTPEIWRRIRRSPSTSAKRMRRRRSDNEIDRFEPILCQALYKLFSDYLAQ